MGRNRRQAGLWRLPNRLLLTVMALVHTIRRCRCARHAREIQKFAGALQGQRAKKGIFITTSSFSSEATDYSRAIDSRIILIDGVRLVKLMVDHNVGVSSAGLYEIKKIDSDYFDEA